MDGLRRHARWSAVAVLLPAVLVVFFGFRAGGFFAGTPAFVAAVLAVVAAGRVLLARAPFAGIGGMALVILGALALLAIWTLASAWWSHSPGRAQVEYARTLMYALAALVLVSAPIRASQMRWALRGLTVAGVIICGAGLVSRVLPRVLPTTSAVDYDRLAYPLTYWNALGLLSAICGALCLHLAASEREPRVVRVLAAAMTPIAAVTLFFTFSRGGVAAAAVALAAYALVARPRGLPSALLSCGPACAIAVKAAYDADLLGSTRDLTDAAVAQGRSLAFVIAACCIGAGAARALLLRLDRRLERLQVGRDQQRRVCATAVASLLVALVAAAALGAPGALADQYREFTRDDPVDTGDFRARLSQTGSNGRVEQWRIALDEFEARPLSGSGAGTFAVLWNQERESTGRLNDGHSLYFETLAELGLPGALLVACLVAALLIALLRRCAGDDRDAYAVAFAVSLAWALHAGIDWDWEMPVVTIIPVALGALAAARGAGEGGRPPVRPVRVVAALGLLFLAIAPASLAVSQARLNDAVRAFERGDCPSTIDSALASSEATGTRAEPFQLLGYCDARLGRDELAVRALRAAVDRDPDDWEGWYGLALVRAHAGLDPRAAADTALRLNPREPIAQQAARVFRTADRARRRRFAQRAPLPVR